MPDERAELKVSLRDVAKQAGVSPMTVSRVINNAASVRQETRERVEKVIASTGLHPEPARPRADIAAHRHDRPHSSRTWPIPSSPSYCERPR